MNILMIRLLDNFFVKPLQTFCRSWGSSTWNLSISRTYFKHLGGHFIGIGRFFFNFSCVLTRECFSHITSEPFFCKKITELTHIIDRVLQYVCFFPFNFLWSDIQYFYLILIWVGSKSLVKEETIYHCPTSIGGPIYMFK